MLVNGKRVPEACSVLQEFPCVLMFQGSSAVTALLTVIDLAVLCPGNSEEEFIQMYEE